MVNTLYFQCRGHRFNPWLGNEAPTYHMHKKKKKKTALFKTIKFVLICFSNNGKLIHSARVTYPREHRILKDTPGRILGIVGSQASKRNGKSNNPFTEGQQVSTPVSTGTYVGVLIQTKEWQNSTQSQYDKQNTWLDVTMLLELPALPLHSVLSVRMPGKFSEFSIRNHYVSSIWLVWSYLIDSVKCVQAILPLLIWFLEHLRLKLFHLWPQARTWWDAFRGPTSLLTPLSLPTFPHISYFKFILSCMLYPAYPSK